MPAPVPRSREDFQVAIICALGLEADAVYNVLDTCWEDEGHHYGKAERDTNFYTTGAIGDHNVIVVRLSAMGTVQASIAASNIRHSFPNITSALIVGICGGVPTGPGHRSDIYLGDLILSSGVIQYDFGRQYPTGFESKTSAADSLTKPGREILNFLSLLDTDRHRRKLRRELSDGLLESTRGELNIRYPGAAQDQLYDSSYVHKHTVPSQCETCGSNGDLFCAVAANESCEVLGCERSGSIVRRRDDTPHEVRVSGHMPDIHIGIIGCGNTVMKSGAHRDRVANKDGIIAFEMEGAGAWDQFPSIIIKSVCDYSDSHKNKDWQSYAAAVAAIGMKAVLKEWRAEYIMTASASGSQNLSLGKPAQSFPIINARTELRKALNYDGMHSRADQVSLPSIDPKSFEWVWSSSFQRWLRLSWNPSTQKSSPFFWITGKPGSGKSTLMGYLADSLQTRKILHKRDERFKVVKFFFDFRAGDTTANSRTGVARMFISQLCDYDAGAEEKLAARNEHEPIKNMSEERLVTTFVDMLETSSIRLLAFIDGLDEYQGNHLDLIRFIQQMQRRTSMLMCLASRPELTFKRELDRMPHFAMENVNAESIRAYINQAVSEAQEKIANCGALLDDALRRQLVQRSEGVIIWIRLVMPELLCRDPANTSKETLQSAIDELPGELEELYDLIFHKTPEGRFQEASLILFFIKRFGGDFEVTFGLWHFFYLEIEDSLPDGISPSGASVLAEFGIRVQILLGSFLDQLFSEKEPASILAFRRNPSPKDSGPPKELRLIHRTLDRYLERSNLIRRSLPQSLLSRYPDALGSRLYADVIATATKYVGVAPGAAYKLKERRNFYPPLDIFDVRRLGMPFKAYRRRSKPPIDWSGIREPLKAMFTDSPWTDRMSLLIQSLRYFVRASQTVSEGGMIENPYGAWKQALESPLLGLSVPGLIQRFETNGTAYHCYAPELYEQPIGSYMHLVAAVLFGLPNYIRQVIQELDIPPETLIELSVRAASFYWAFFRPLSFLDDMGFFGLDSGWDAPRRHALCLALILGQCNEIHPWIIKNIMAASKPNYKDQLYATLGPEPSVGYDTAYHLLVSTRRLPLMRFENVTTCSVQCECLDFKYMTDCRRSLEVSSQEHTATNINLLLLSRLVELNWPRKKACETHEGPLSFLLRPRFGFGKPFTFRLLVILARLGVDPSIKHGDNLPGMENKGRTPLEWLRRDIPQFAVRKDTKEKREFLLFIASALEYHQEHGRWPDFAALIRDWDSKHPELQLDHPILHRIDDDGKIHLWPNEDHRCDECEIWEPVQREIDAREEERQNERTGSQPESNT